MRMHLKLATLLMLFSLPGCGGGGGQGSGEAPAPTEALTGLYESGEGPRRNQLCLIEKEGRGTTFGFVTWGSGGTNCSGTGIASRESDRLRLRLEGDDACVLDARIDGSRVTLPAAVPDQCQRYYCGNGARINGVAFDKVGSTETDARRAADLVGDPLCPE